MEPPKNIKTSFQNEVYLWRLFCCVLWVIAIYLLSSMCLIFMLNADIFHPVQWIKDFMAANLSLSAVGYNSVLIAFAVGLTLMYASHYTVVPVVFLTRLEMIWNVLKPSRFAVTCGYSICGGLLVALWLNLAVADGSFSGLTQPCLDDGAKQCLNENHLVLVLHGAFIGFLYGIDLFVNNHNYVTFPIIQQSRFFQIKSELSSRIKTSLTFIIKSAKWFFTFYALFGLSLQIWITNLLHVRFSSEAAIPHLWNLFNLKLWWTAWLTGATVNLSFSIIEFIFKVFQTQRIVLPIATTFEEERFRDLKTAIGTADFPLLQYLGYLDLNLAVQHSVERRQELFDISQPGGHPHQWNAIISTCLLQIKTLMQKLRACYEPPLPQSKSASETSSVSTGLRKNFPLSPDYEMWRMQNLYSSSPYLVKSPLSSCQTAMGAEHFSPALKPLPTIANALKSNFEKRTNSLWSSISNIPLLAFFMRELPDARVRKIFAEAQLCIWAVEAISCLIAASFVEDKYGVGQRDLPDILETLLNLQQAINKVKKMEVPTSKRQPNSSSHPYDIALRHSLKCNLKLGLYLITTTFQDHLRSVDLSAEHRKLVIHYLEYKE